MLPTSLEILDISGGDVYTDGRDHHKFTGGIPPEWGALTNLKELKMARCGLDGAFGSTRSEPDFVLIWSLFFAGQLPKELGKLVNLKVFIARNNKLRGGLTRIPTERHFADILNCFQENCRVRLFE